VTEFSAIRSAIVTALSPLNDRDAMGTGADWIEVSDFAVPEPGLRVPIICVWGLQDADWVGGMHQGGTDIEVLVRAITGTLTEIPPQMTIDFLLMGESSVKSLLETDKTLGGTVDDLFVSNMTGHREFPLGGSRVLGADWNVQILLPGI